MLGSAVLLSESRVTSLNQLPWRICIFRQRGEIQLEEMVTNPEDVFIVLRCNLSRRVMASFPILGRDYRY